MKVAVAIITNSKQQVLIARRPTHATHPGMWEFPGGKLELDEAPAAALVREIKEEVGLLVLNFVYLGEVNHTYLDRQVSLLIFHVDHFEGDAQCCEAQLDLRWVDFATLSDFEFPAANNQIIELIKRKLL